MKKSISETYAWVVKLYQEGNKELAALICEKIIEAEPRHSPSLNLLGLILLDNKKYDEAAALFEKAANASPEAPEYYNNLGSLYQELSQFNLAEKYFRQSSQINNRQPDILSNLASALQAQQKFDEAAHYYGDALRYSKSNPRLLLNLGSCLEKLGNLDEAAFCYREILAIDPQHVAALNNLGNFHEKLGEFDSAIRYYELALKNQPALVITLNNLGLTLLQKGEYATAIAHFLNAIEIKPDYADAYRNLGDACDYQGKTREAAEFYRHALKLNNQSGLRIRLATLIPAIMQSADSITNTRLNIDHALSILEQDENLKISDPVSEVRSAFFFLAYHGRCNKDLKIRLAKLFERICPWLLWTAPHCSMPKNKSDKIKIGIISKYLYNHSIGKTTQGLIAKLPKDRFRVISIFVQPVIDDQTSRFIRMHSDEVLELNPILKKAQLQIAELELDILFYQDIGMDPFTYFLAYSRLAPVQCTSFGHPETSGISNLDYYISSELFETDNAQVNYSETLYKLKRKSLLTYYYRPTLPETFKSRDEYGFSETDHLYLCPQTLYKFHPCFDDVLAKVLSLDSFAKVVLLEGNVPNYALLLRQRFQANLGELSLRVFFLPIQSPINFVNLIAISDVMLDIPSFNGFNSNLEAFMVGTPIVTLPGELQCTRHCTGMFLKMGIYECIAKNTAEYVNIALNLATDSVFRRKVSSKILAANHLLFEDSETILSFSDFFEECIIKNNQPVEI